MKAALSIEAGSLFAQSAAQTRATLTLPECPSANRWWRNVNGRMITSKEARDYKERVALIGSRHKMPDGPVRVTIDWYRGKKSGDLDKRVGVLLDALQGVLFDNDSQITELVARRHDDKGNARMIVTAEAL